MALIRWQPFHEMDALQRDMNRMFETLASGDRNSTRHFLPLAEMERTEDAVHIRVEMPGMNAEDLDVQVTKDAVTISGDRQSRSKTEKNGMMRSEFRYGSFQRTIPLPLPIDRDRVQGNYRDGILELDLPLLKQQENKVTKVKISSDSQQNSLSYSSDRSKARSSRDSENTIPTNIVAGKTVVNRDDFQSGTENNTADNGGYGGNTDVWNDTLQNNTDKAIAN